jgi:UDP-N-acetylglucosamine--N-acetylmuramyl-(pentapeptide) pyrophosphoryl-undecaprenol N-acetylglucosamine transferase
VISRAGALSISELCLVKKPVIFVPSPNVAEDHQTKNAKALVEKDAALMVEDRFAIKDLVSTALKLLADNDKKAQLSENITKLGKPNATDDIVNEILELARMKE